MTLNTVQYAAQPVSHQPRLPKIIYADVERSIFERMLKKWSHKKTVEAKSRKILQNLMTQKEVAEKYGLSQKTLEQLRKQGVGFATKVIKGTVYYTREHIENHYALVKFLHPKTEYAPPCSLNAFISLIRPWKQRRAS